MSASLRRLANDQMSLRRNPLPPNYLFPAGQEDNILPDDLTKLTILLTGSCGTPYTEGLWQLNLRIPTNYPQSPPKAVFKTRIWHPNVDESTGAVCLETLKRDWDPKLTLRDILVTISCLLVHPNPDSALNSAAGALLQDSYDSFASQARLMTSLHARIPATMRQAVEEARRRGEENNDANPAELTQTSSLSLGKRRLGQDLRLTSPVPRLMPTTSTDDAMDTDEDDDENDIQKENDPSQSPTPVIQSPLTPRSTVLGKRPLSELPVPTEEEVEEDMVASEKNIANQSNIEAGSELEQPPRKAAKVTKANTLTNGRSCFTEPSFNSNNAGSSSSSIWVDPPLSCTWADEKENMMFTSTSKGLSPKVMQPPPRPGLAAQKPSATAGKSILKGKSKVTKPRTGIRRI